MSSSRLEGFYNYMFGKSQNEDLLAFPNLPLLGSRASIILADITYILFVFKIGPWLMRNREPFNLKKVIMAYNALQVILNFALLIASIYYLFIADFYDFGCVLKLPLNHPAKLGEVILSYTGYLTRCMDYCDTIFFVLRKSYRQVTFLHVYHHLLMSFAIYSYIRDYGFGGHGFAGGTINCFVHVVMYSYYFMSANRPEMKKSIWWKRHLTELQLLQFALAFIHQMWPIVVKRDCPFPKFWLAITTSQLIVLFILFGKFYKKTYLSKKAALQDEDPNTKLVKKAL